MPWSTRAGVFGITRTTATSSGSRSSTKAVVIPAAMLTTSAPGRSAGPISASRAAMSCGLTTITTVSAPAAASVLLTHRDPVPVRQLGGTVRRRSVITTSSGVQPGPQQAGEQGLAHHPGAENRDRLTHSCSVRPATNQAQLLVSSERRKNATFAGRSASRRMK